MAEGFEPSDGGYPSHAFEACSLGRSDTPPCGSLPARSRLAQIALTGEERLQRRRALVGQHAAAHLGPVRQPAVAHHVPQRADRARSWAPTPRTPAARPAPSPARRRTSCTARRSPPAWCPPAASRRRAPRPRPAAPGSRRARSGRRAASRALAARASSVPSGPKTTAPIGTSSGPARTARRRARRGSGRRRGSPIESVEHRRQLVGEAHLPGDPAELLVGVQVGLVER